MVHNDRTTVVFSICVLMIISAFTIDSAVPLTSFITQSLNVDKRLAPLVVTSYLLGYGIGQIPAGLLVDRLGRKPVIYAGLTIFIVAGAVSALATNIWVLFALRFAQGFGGAVGPVASRAIARDVSEGGRTVALMSVLTIALALNSVLAPLIGSFVGSLWGWRLTLALAPLLGIVVFGLCVRYVPETGKRQSKQSTFRIQMSASWQAFKGQPQCIWATLINTLCFGGYVVFLGNASTILEDVYHYDVSIVGPLITLVIVPYILAVESVRRLGARFAPLKILKVGVIVLGLTGVMLVFAGFSEQLRFTLFWPILACYMIGFGLIFPSATALVIAPLPNVAGFAASIMGTAQIVFGSAMATMSGIFYAQSITSLAWAIGAVGILAPIVFYAGRPN